MDLADAKKLQRDHLKRTAKSKDNKNAANSPIMKKTESPTSRGGKKKTNSSDDKSFDMRVSKGIQPGANNKAQIDAYTFESPSFDFHFDDDL